MERLGDDRAAEDADRLRSEAREGPVEPLPRALPLPLVVLQGPEREDRERLRLELPATGV